MPERSGDWIRQAEKDLENEWACFSAHQSAEKALKAVYHKLGYPMSTSHRKMQKRPSLVLEKSYGSVRVFWLQREEAIKRLKSAAENLIMERPEVEEAVLFGSLNEGKAIPGSDADLLIVVKKKHETEDYIDYFADVGIPCDLFCYTREELEENNFARSAYQKGRVLARRRNTHQG